jgi:hypothetical protein
MKVLFILIHSPSSRTRSTLATVTPHFLPTQGARFRAWHHTLKGVHARSDRITCCCRFLHWPHALEPRPACSRKDDSMSTPSKRDVASGSARSRKSSTSRTRSPTHARKDLELVSLVLTHVQHWRGQIIAARAAPRGVRIATYNQRPNQASCEIRSASRSRVQACTRCWHSKADFCEKE